MKHFKLFPAHTTCVYTRVNIHYRLKKHERDNLVHLLELLKEEFQRKRLLLAIAIGDDIMMRDGVAFAKYPDHVYVSQNQWNNLYRHQINSDLPPTKIIETLSIVGTLRTKMYNYGVKTTEKNIVSSDVCHLLASKNWTKSYNKITFNNTASLDEKDKTHVLTFQDSRSIAARVRDAIRHDLAGIAILPIMDDFEGKCHWDDNTFEDFGGPIATQRFDIPNESKFLLLRTANTAIIAALEEMALEARLIKLDNQEIPNTIAD